MIQQHAPKKQAEADKNIMKRVETIRFHYDKWVGSTTSKGIMIVHLNITQRQLNWASGANFSLFSLYHTGQGVAKDRKKELYHLEVAAIAGHPTARYNLAVREKRKEDLREQ